MGKIKTDPNPSLIMTSFYPQGKNSTSMLKKLIGNRIATKPILKISQITTKAPNYPQAASLKIPTHIKITIS